MSKPKPIKEQERIAFGISWFKTEAEADEFAKTVTTTFNGGYFHGAKCGRDRGFDYIDKKHGKLFAVTR